MEGMRFRGNEYYLLMKPKNVWHSHWYWDERMRIKESIWLEDNTPVSAIHISLWVRVAHLCCITPSLLSFGEA